MSISVIITAGGVGKRMGASVPKQFIPINDKPILMYTLARFYQYDPQIQLILTLPEGWVHYWENLLIENDFKIPHRIITGGAERFDSVRNALEYCSGKYIAIHDGVRPLVSRDTLDRCFHAVRSKKAVIPVISVLESMRMVHGSGSKVVDREQFLLVQTPQCFDADLIKEAYQMTSDSSFTDDASVLESMGHRVHTVEGNRENIKITTSFDVQIAQYLL